MICFEIIYCHCIVYCHNIVCLRMDLTNKICLKTILLCTLVGYSSEQYGSMKGSSTTYTGLFQRLSGKRLSAISTRSVPGISVEQCAQRCVTQTEFQCLYFDYDNDEITCILFDAHERENYETLMDSAGKDHYRAAYLQQFRRLPGHLLQSWVQRTVEHISEEDCARRCILETYFNCRGFNYLTAINSCTMTDATVSDGHGLLGEENTDYYERETGGPLEQFLNYGHQALKQLDDVNIYEGVIPNINLAQCASECLTSSGFLCSSFDYIHAGEESTCYLSSYIAANVFGLRDSSDRVNHYERIETDLATFYPTPYSLILANNLKTYKYITPNQCARKCMEESTFVCRSFDYELGDGKCALSSKTGSDVGGLYTNHSAQVHHFEMKPILDCGGNLTAETGSFASPGWPRDYHHHLQCIWNIQAPKNKVIHINLIRTVFATQSDDPCSLRNDRLLYEESGIPKCVTDKNKKIISLTNNMEFKFYSNAIVDAQGFRAFYSAEWTCDVRLTTPGEIASPKWPSHYPSDVTCFWTLSAPPDHVVSLRFTEFSLEQDPLGDCNDEYDHVKIMDGSSREIGQYCGYHDKLSVQSTGRDMVVLFVPDTDKMNVGFHAYFDFVPIHTTNSTSALIPKSKGDEKEKHPDINVTFRHLDIDYNDVDSNVWRTGVDKTTTTTEYEVEDTRETNNSVIEPEISGSTENVHNYKTTMWIIVTMLLLAFIGAVIILFLVWRHYRRKLEPKQQERTVIRNDEIAETTVDRDIMYTAQLRQPLVPKQNNLYTSARLLGNEVVFDTDTEGASASSASSTTSSCLEKEALEKYPRKYEQDNMKNMHTEKKQNNEYCLTVDLPDKFEAKNYNYM